MYTPTNICDGVFVKEYPVNASQVILNSVLVVRFHTIRVSGIKNNT